MTVKKKATLLDCGHLSLTGKCDICTDRDALEAIRSRTAAEPSRPGPTQPATAAPVAAVAVLGTGSPTPGIYQIPDSIYFRDPLKAYGTESLSGSSARHLIPPSTPAHYRWKMDHPNEPTAAMIFGGAVHAITLETAELAIFEGRSWDSKAGEKFLLEHDPDGDDAPILERDVPAAKAMAYALRTHPIVSKALRNGNPEQAMFAQDPQTKAWLRGKLDYLQPAASGHLVVTDIKTAVSAHEWEFARSAGKLSYHVSDAHYARILRLLKMAKSVTMIYAVVESKPPYLVNVHQIKHEDLRRADELDQLAIHTFARCLETGQWPGYPVRINEISIPVYAARNEEEALDSAEGEPQ